MKKMKSMFEESIPTAIERAMKELVLEKDESTGKLTLVHRPNKSIPNTQSNNKEK